MPEAFTARQEVEHAIAVWTKSLKSTTEPENAVLLELAQSWQSVRSNCLALGSDSPILLVFSSNLNFTQCV